MTQTPDNDEVSPDENQQSGEEFARAAFARLNLLLTTDPKFRALVGSLAPSRPTRRRRDLAQPPRPRRPKPIEE